VDILCGGNSIIAKASFNAESKDLDMDIQDSRSQSLQTGDSTDEKSSDPPKRKKLKVMKGLPATTNIMLNLTNHGFTNKPGELSIIKYSFATGVETTPEEAAAIVQIIDRTPPEKPEIEKFINEDSDRIKMAEKVISRTAFFYRLRRVLYLLQNENYCWPNIAPQWESPVVEYGLLLGIHQYGIQKNDIELFLEDPKLGLKNAKPLSPKIIEKRARKLVIELELQFSGKLDKEWPVDFTPLQPKEWEEKHSNIYSRAYLYENETLELFHTLIAIGKPIKDGEIDWERIRKFSAIKNVTTEAIREAAQQMYEVADRYLEKEGDKRPENKPVDVHEYSKLACLQGKIKSKEVRKLNQTIKEMISIRDFAANIDSNIIELMKCAPTADAFPKWWTWEQDKALIENLAEYGASLCISWIVDKNGPFYPHIPKYCLGPFEDAAAREIESGKAAKVDNQCDDFYSLLRERSRMKRALLVIAHVSKELTKNDTADMEYSDEETIEKYKIVRQKPLINLQNTCRVLKLGTLRLTDGFVGENIVYPVGYCALRRFKLKGECPYFWYKCMVEEKDQKPYFIVETVTRHKQRVYESNSPNDVWNNIASDLAKEYNLQPQKVIGPWLFGLSIKTVQRELARLPNGEKIPYFKKEFYDANSGDFTFQILREKRDE
jgi:hypothetical protein